MPREWDNRHQAPIYEWSSLRSVVLQPQEASPGPVRHRLLASGELADRYAVESLYVPGSTDTLIVAFHGALVRKNVELPRFEWLGVLRNRPEHRLFISDTTLLDSDFLTLAWYIGNEYDDLTAKITRFVNHVAKQLAVARTVLLGSSGGGYAALAIAPSIENSNALAFSPQTEVWKFSKGHTRNLLASSFPEHSSEEELSRHQPHRFSLMARYQDLQKPSRFLYVQNSGDTEHVDTHYTPFAASRGATGPNGRTADGYGRFVSFHYGEGHVPPPRDRVGELLDTAISDIESPQSPPPATSTCDRSGTACPHEH